MTRPIQFVLRMALFLAGCAVVAFLVSPVLVTAYGNNRPLNTLILLVLLLGIVWNVVQVMRLGPEVRWIEALRQPRAGLAPPPAPRLLAPMASMLAARDREQRLVLSTPAARSLLDSLASRLDEGRELSRYMTGLLIFLGLLGTFYGLILTVGSVGDVIAGMSIAGGDANAMFDQLKRGLARPLHGMGTAFSGSMFGLAGALVLGFLDLTAGQAQNRFFNELEEWLAGITRFSSGASGLDGDGASALLERLDRIVQRSEEDRAELRDALGRFAAREDGDPGRLLRGIEHLLQRILAEMERGRSESTAALRQELRTISRTLGAQAEAEAGLPPPPRASGD